MSTRQIHNTDKKILIGLKRLKARETRTAGSGPYGMAFQQQCDTDAAICLSVSTWFLRAFLKATQQICLKILHIPIDANITASGDKLEGLSPVDLACSSAA